MSILPPNGFDPADFNPADYIPLAEAARRLPSRIPGKRIASATVWRWVMQGKLPAIRIGRNYFVRPQDLEDYLVKPFEPAKPLPRCTSRQQRANDRWTEETLKRAGLDPESCKKMEERSQERRRRREEREAKEAAAKARTFQPCAVPIPEAVSP